MNVQQVLNQFQATGVETCFHDRHINPQIYAGLNGKNWGIRDYEARGGYAALRKMLGETEATPRVKGMCQDVASNRADQIRRMLVAQTRAMDQIGLYEWIDPETGRGYGSSAQGWSAALWVLCRD